MQESLKVKLTEREFNNLYSPLAKDLTAVFNLMEDEINNLVKQGVEEGWTPDELIQKIEKLI